MRSLRATHAFFLITVLLGLLRLPPASRAGEPSAAYRASLQRTLELRKQRRAARASQQPVGVVVPFPMPPTLIIRHTRETHEEIETLLLRLRYLPPYLPEIARPR